MDKMWKNAALALVCTIFVTIASFFIFGRILGAILNYNSVEASYHLPTHALLIGLIFTLIYCTLKIINSLEK